MFEKNSTPLFKLLIILMEPCKKCEGFGITLGLDRNKIIKNKELSLYEGVVSCWSGLNFQNGKKDLYKIP